jgi:hypothetical protein
MPRRMHWFICTALALAGSSGCGLLCDRYCERSHNCCDRGYHDRCGSVQQGCYSPPANNCGPAPGVYTAQPQPYCP